ncbi:hypothetical protein ACV3J7_20835 [Salmonella enterica]
MKTFFAVFFALIAFSGVCAIVYYIHDNMLFNADVEKCINDTNAKLIMKGMLNITPEMKTEITKECREAK